MKHHSFKVVCAILYIYSVVYIIVQHKVWRCLSFHFPVHNLTTTKNKYIGKPLLLR